MDFKCIISKHINEKFCYIQYGDLSLMMMKDNYFINATKLCHLGGKEFRKWVSLYTSKSLIDELSEICPVWKINVYRTEGIIIAKLYDDKSYKEYDVTGSYVHYDLIPHISSWVFSSFAVKLSDTINKYASNNYILYRKTDNDFIDEIVEFILEYDTSSHLSDDISIEKYLNMLYDS